MTMFSMKPKFDMAEFLAVPAAKGKTGRRNSMSYTSKAKSSSDPKETSTSKGAKTPS